ncbi:MAG: homoserine O-succinyltransferase [Gammaproteobacteria bacterium]|nr:homoserine O-succinyltransferase [Gammaproteobacteria bacterium]
MSKAQETEVVDGILELPSPWTLHHGGRLDAPRIAYRIEGPPSAPVVAALGGISAHRRVSGDDPGGWWPAVVGAGRGVDSAAYRILGIDYLGGSGDSSAPDGVRGFPAVSAFDQAAALAAIVRERSLGPLHAIVGASYGGMIALSFASRFSDLVGRIIVISASDHARPLATAWRSVQRQIVREAIERGDGAAGLKLARALAMTTYRSAAEFEERFSGPALFEDGRFRFPVERYLFARGDDYVRKYRPESFVALSESIDLHAMDASQVRTPATLIAVCEDQLVPLADIQTLAGRLSGSCRLVRMNSIFGHDAFLKEGEKLKPIIERALAEATK